MKVADKWTVYSVMFTSDTDLIVVVCFFPPVPVGPTGRVVHMNILQHSGKKCVYT
jgi:hypothetical protein